MEHFEKTLESEIIYVGQIVTLRRDKVELENGNTAYREVVEHPGGVAVLAVDSGDNVFFVRQFRYPTGKALWELPAGKMERGENPEVCGRRELEEETGHTAADFRLLGKCYPTPGYVGEILYLYLARGLTSTAQRLDSDEFLDVEKMPLEKAVGMCLNGEMEDAKTIAALLQYNELRRRGQV